MDQQTVDKIKREVWNSGGGIVTDQTVHIIAEIIIRECSGFIRCLDNGNFYAIADALEGHLKSSKIMLDTLE